MLVEAVHDEDEPEMPEGASAGEEAMVKMAEKADEASELEKDAPEEPVEQEAAQSRLKRSRAGPSFCSTLDCALT